MTCLEHACLYTLLLPRVPALYSALYSGCRASTAAVYLALACLGTPAHRFCLGCLHIASSSCLASSYVSCVPWIAMPATGHACHSGSLCLIDFSPYLALASVCHCLGAICPALTPENNAGLPPASNTRCCTACTASRGLDGAAWVSLGCACLLPGLPPASFAPPWVLPPHCLPCCASATV